jgi:hypothetical protein
MKPYWFLCRVGIIICYILFAMILVMNFNGKLTSEMGLKSFHLSWELIPLMFQSRIFQFLLINGTNMIADIRE